MLLMQTIKSLVDRHTLLAAIDRCQSFFDGPQLLVALIKRSQGLDQKLVLRGIPPGGHLVTNQLLDGRRELRIHSRSPYDNSEHSIIPAARPLAATKRQ